MSKTSQVDPGQDLDLDVQLVDLGDAKELTMGTPSTEYAEDNPQFPRKITT